MSLCLLGNGIRNVMGQWWTNERKRLNRNTEPEANDWTKFGCGREFSGGRSEGKVARECGGEVFFKADGP
jgi:hypothetical protein